MQPDDQRFLAGTALIAAADLGLCIVIGSGTARTFELSAYACHLLMAALYAGLFTLWLKATDIEAHRAFWFPAAMTACLPVLGTIGITLAVWCGRRMSHYQTERPLTFTESPKLPHQPPELEKNLKFATGGLGDILEHSSDMGKRVLAVTAASRMTERDAMPFLKLAMSDTADEVRLLAFSVKDKIETNINDKIKHNLGRLPEASDSDRPTIHRALAFLYWELVYLDIAEGDLRLFMLDEADDHAQSCLTLSTQPSLHVLRGRIALEKRNGGKAEQHFQAALEAGAEPESVATYLAEAAFLKQDYAAVPEHLSALPLHLQATAPFYAVCRHWGLN